MEKDTSEEVEFELPVIDGAKVVKPRVHISEGTCLNCEG
jgi:hypothetical protein